MFATAHHEVAADAGLDETIAALPSGPAVFAIALREGEPYLGRTGDLRRRLARLLKAKEKPGRLLNLRSLAERIEYWPVGSGLESSLVLYENARRLFPRRYAEFLKLRSPVFLRLLTAHAFPRTQVTTKTSGPGVTYGPFRSRAAAEQFEHELLDLFQLRRCQEDLQPSPDHPGCIYGEMNKCLRPCQQAVSPEEYASEGERVAEFLRTDGKTAKSTAQAARDRLSSELEFEAAAAEHARIEHIDELMKLKDDLARDTRQLCGIAVLPAADEGSVMLLPLLSGFWQPPLLLAVLTGSNTSLDARLREAFAAREVVELTVRDREEHLAILMRWYWSSWRDGMWIGCDGLDRLPWRRLVTAISKVVHRKAPAASQ